MPRALVIDDSHAMRAFVRAALEEIDSFEVSEAATGFQALRELTQGEFDLIVVDVNMPDINGLEVVSFASQEQGSSTTLRLSSSARKAVLGIVNEPCHSVPTRF